MRVRLWRVLLFVSSTSAWFESYAKKDWDHESIKEGHTALRKGLHHKAFEHYKTAWKTDPRSAYEHVELHKPHAQYTLPLPSGWTCIVLAWATVGITLLSGIPYLKGLVHIEPASPRGPAGGEASPS